MSVIDGSKFSQLIGRAGGFSNIEVMTEFLLWLRRSYDLKHVNFTATGIDFSDVLLSIGTYHRDWIDRFKSEDAACHDPVLRLAREGTPIDWETIQVQNDMEAIILDARRSIVGRKAVSIPASSSDGNTSLMTFVMNDDEDYEEWSGAISKLYIEFKDVGMMLHAAFLDQLGLTPPKIELSERHMDCLRMLASGMNEPQMAEILSVSVKTVKKYIGETRLRLRARTKAQAVATAISNGILEID